MPDTAVKSKAIAMEAVSLLSPRPVKLARVFVTEFSAIKMSRV
jgi:hypothetical protein